MKHVTLLLSLIIGITIMACSQKPNISNIQPIEYSESFKQITINDISDAVSIDTIISEYSYLPLETSEECLIGKIKKIIVTDQKIIISDSQTNTIFFFNHDGSFDLKINKRGNGPGEYRTIDDIAVNSQNNQLIILDGDIQKLLFYNLTNGDFIRDQKMRYRSFAFAQTDNNNYCFDCKYEMRKKSNGYSLIFSDNNLNAYSGAFERQNFISPEITPFYQCGINTYYCSNYSNIIYKIESNNIIKQYDISFTKRDFIISELPKSLFSSAGYINGKRTPILDTDKLNKYFYQKDIAYHLHNILETSHHLYFKFVYQQRVGQVIINKKDKSNNAFLSYYQNDELYGGSLHTVYKDYFIGAVNYDQLISKLEYITFSEKQKKIIDQLDLNNKNKMYDNPILTFVKFK